MLADMLSDIFASIVCVFVDMLTITANVCQEQALLVQIILFALHICQTFSTRLGIKKIMGGIAETTDGSYELMSCVHSNVDFQTQYLFIPGTKRGISLFGAK